MSGRSATGGTLNLSGETLRTPLQTNLKVRGENFLISEIDRLVNLPSINLQSGRASGDITVQLLPNQKVPELGEPPNLRGNAKGTPGAPGIFSSKGGLQLQGKVIRLRNVDAVYGQVPLSATGAVDLQKALILPPRSSLSASKGCQNLKSAAAVYNSG